MYIIIVIIITNGTKLILLCLSQNCCFLIGWILKQIAIWSLLSKQYRGYQTMYYLYVFFCLASLLHISFIQHEFCTRLRKIPVTCQSSLASKEVDDRSFLSCCHHNSNTEQFTTITFFYSHAYRCIVALQARRQKGQEPGRERVELKVFCNSHGGGKLCDLSHAL